MVAFFVVVKFLFCGGENLSASMTGPLFGAMAFIYTKVQGEILS